MAHYDPSGNPLSETAGAALMADFETRRIGYDVVMTDGGPVEVSTMYIPEDQRTQADIEAGTPPLIYETAALLHGGHDVLQERRSTGQEALFAHLDVLDRIRTGRLS